MEDDRPWIVVGISVAAVGLFLGVRAIINKVIDRTWKETDNFHHRTIQSPNKIEIYSSKNDPAEWQTMDDSKEYETYELMPIYYLIHNQNSEILTIDNRQYKLALNVDVRLNKCELIKVESANNNKSDQYRGILNHPTQLCLTIEKGDDIIVYGKEIDGIFAITHLSNYTEEEYKSTMRWLFTKKVGSVLILCSAAILFTQFKE